MCVHFSNLIIWELHFKVQTLFAVKKFVLLLPPLIFSFLKLLFMGFYGCDLLLDSSSSWLIFSLKWRLLLTLILFHSAVIKIQKANESIDKEDPRPTNSTWSYTGYFATPPSTMRNWFGMSMFTINLCIQWPSVTLYLLLLHDENVLF